MNSNLVVDDDAPLKVKRAFAKFFKQLSPGHSLTSRQFSIFTLMRDIIDPEINALVIAPTMSDLLPGIESFSVSGMWTESRPLDGVLEIQTWLNATKRLHVADIQLSFECGIQLKQLRSLQKFAQWDSFIRLKDVNQPLNEIKALLNKAKQIAKHSQVEFDAKFEDGFESELERSIFQIQHKIDAYQAAKKRIADTVNICEFDRRVICGASWMTYIQQAIRRLQSIQKCTQIIPQMESTFETLLSFITYCNDLKPKRIRSPRGRYNLQSSGIKANLGKSVLAYEYEPWFKCCSMCFRPTVFTVNASITSSELKENQISYQSKITGSRNYCKEHDPANPASSYRKDLKRKQAFLHEVNAVTNSTKSNFKVKLKPIDGSKVEIRRLAYALVQSRLKGNKENVGLMLSQGLKQTEIARRLGISRQAVSKIKASIPKELEMIYKTMWLRDINPASP
jgi:hypothetical protein